MTPLEKLIRELIDAEGPIGLDRYMGLCLGHPEFGYYMGRDPFGEKGDFITAPEVSQMFGELIGVWCVAAWEAMGSPGTFCLAELGPGRGTLMADVLRVTSKAAPGFTAAAQVHVVETSPALRAAQRKVLGEAVQWHDNLDSLPDMPMILVANEFFDAIPIRQFEKRDGRWHQRGVGLKDDRLVVGLVESNLGPEGKDGDIIEFGPARIDMAREIGKRLARQPGAALIIDYGHLRTAPGDTLQAMRAHKHVSILERPGECDITSHVDFEALATALTDGGATVHGVLAQQAFLLAMGLERRFEILASKADTETRGVLERQMTRLAGSDQMGNLFKVLAATSPGLSIPYPFGRT